MKHEAGCKWPIPIIKRVDYDRAQERLDELAWQDIDENHPDWQELNLLILLIDKYNEEHFKIEEPDPIDYLKYILEQKGMKQKDLIPFIGNKTSVSQIMNRRRRLTLEQAKRLHDELNIPANILLRA